MYFCAMKFTELSLPGLWLIEPVRHGDARGYFSETFRADLFAEATGCSPEWVQENESLSHARTVRGLHFQAGDAAQAKLVRVCRGRIVDVVVDLRRDSPTFGWHCAVEISADNGRQLFVPRGMAHGFAVLSDEVLFLYKVDNYYCPSAERTIALDDADLAVAWPVPEEERLLSPKDRLGMSWKQFVESGE